MSALMPLDSGICEAAAARNFAGVAAEISGGIPEARVTAPGDVVIVDSSVADPTFNVITAARFGDDPAHAEERIAQVLADVRATGRPFTWWVDPGSEPADLDLRLRNAGLTDAGTAPVMVADLANLDDLKPTRVPGLEIRRVSTLEEYRDFARLIAKSWDPPSATAAELFAKAEAGFTGAEGPALMFVGYLDGVPACASELMLSDGVAGLYNIVTMPEFQRRGLGAAMTVAAMRAGREAGYRSAVLEASPMGEPVYRRLGFETRGYFVEFEITPNG